MRSAAPDLPGYSATRGSSCGHLIRNWRAVCSTARLRRKRICTLARSQTGFSPSRVGHLWVRSVRKSIHDAGDAVLEEGDVEVDEQSQTLIGQAQMSQELFLVNGCHGIDRFDLHHYLVLDDQVCAESHLDPDLLIDNRDRWLPHRVQTPLLQFVCQDHFVDRFQQPRSEAGMHTVGRIYDLFGHLVSVMPS